MGSKYGTYVNNELVTTKKLNHGDVIFIMGLKIIVLGDTIIFNNIGNLVRFSQNMFLPAPPLVQPRIEEETSSEENVEFFKEEDYFFRSPRFKAGIEPVNIVIDSPPAKQQQEDTPVLYVIGPMLGMGMTSLLTGYNSINAVMNGQQTWKASIPALVTCVVMLMSMVLWPLLNRK